MFNVYFWFVVASLQLKEELLDGEEYSFLQGVSDQESNGSASYYIKQEPWGSSRGTALVIGKEPFSKTDWFCSHLDGAVQVTVPGTLC